MWKRKKNLNHLNNEEKLSKNKVVAIILTSIFLLVGVIAFIFTAIFQKWDVIGYLKSPQAIMIYVGVGCFILISSSLYFGLKEIK